MSDTSAGITRLAVAASLEDLRKYVESAGQIAGLDGEITFDLKLAADEVCSNIVEHGYKGKTAGPIGLNLEVHDREARLTITDRGRPFHPEAAPTPDLESDWETRPIGGLGWHLIQQVVDRYEYDTDPEGCNRLRLYKRLLPSQETDTKGAEMEITVEHQDPVVLVKIVGSIDSLTAGDLSASLTKEIEGGARQLVVDMSGIDYTSSAGVRALLGTVKLARQHGGDLRLAAAQKGVYKVLELTGLTSILQSYDGVDEAMASFGAPSADPSE